MTESELRRWVRGELGLQAYWVEHARGGTVGMADCFVAVENSERGGGHLVPLELKVGPLREKESETALGKESGMWWKMDLRPAQAKVADRLRNQGVGTFVLVGNEYGKDVWLMGDRALDAAEGGWVKLVGPVRDGGELMGMLEKWGGL